AALGQLGERAAFQPPDLLRGDPEAPARLPQGRRVVAVDPVPKPDHLPLAFGKLVQSGAYGVLLERDLDLLLWRSLAARDKRTERGVLLLPHRAIEAGDDPRRVARLADLAF